MSQVTPENVRNLALSADGTRLVQEALEEASVEHRMALAEALRGHVNELLDDYHGNHVLQKCLHVMHPYAVKFILVELSNYPGGWAEVVKHKFGCRVVERVLEHCGEEVTTPVVNVVVDRACEFVTHPYANYVMQHILEHGASDHKRQVTSELIRIGIPNLANHYISSWVVEKALDFGCLQCQHAIAQSIVKRPNAIVEMACTRFGSLTVKRVLEVLKEPALAGQYRDAMQQLFEGSDKLRKSKKHGRRFANLSIAFFNQVTFEQAQTGGA